MTPLLANKSEKPAWAALLERFYRRARLRLPDLRRLKAEEIPQPYRDLLAHSRDMTPTLEKFYRAPLSLTVLRRELEADSYLREVTLEAGNRTVAYGAIHILLHHFPPPARRLILEEVRPLGSILESEGIGHISWPQAFFRVEADAHMTRHLRVEAGCELFGRRNVLLDGSRRLLAEVIEVLAPV